MGVLLASALWQLLGQKLVSAASTWMASSRKALMHSILFRKYSTSLVSTNCSMWLISWRLARIYKRSYSLRCEGVCKNIEHFSLRMNSFVQEPRIWVHASQVSLGKDKMQKFHSETLSQETKKKKKKQQQQLSGCVTLCRCSLFYAHVWLPCLFPSKVEELRQISTTPSNTPVNTKSCILSGAPGFRLWISSLYLDCFVVHWLQWTI